MTPRRRQPVIDLSDDDAAKLREAGFTAKTVKGWREKTCGPYAKVILRINQILGRVVREAVTAPEPVASPRSNSHHHIEINPCVSDEVCVVVRREAMRPVANTLLDSHREIFCANCKLGIERARVQAANRKPTHGEGPRYCADPDCSRILSWGAKGDHCNIHKISRRRATP